MVQAGDSEEMIARQLHEEEIERLKQEIQQCKEFIQTQQQLLQVSRGTVSFNPLMLKSHWCLKLQVNTSRAAFLDPFFSTATAQHTLWWRDCSCSEWFLHAWREGTLERRVESVWRTEEKLWNGKEKFHRGCHQIGPWGSDLWLFFYGLLNSVLNSSWF